jgi:predicted HicB family RNase H-like nuclease
MGPWYANETPRRLAMKRKEKDKQPLEKKTIQVPEQLWKAARVKAVQRGHSLSEICRKRLEQYVRE